MWIKDPFLNSKDNLPVQHWAFFSFFELTHCFPPSQWTSPLAPSLIWHWTNSHQPTHGSALCNLSRHDHNLKHQTHCNHAYNFHRAGEAMHLIMGCIIQAH
jgi:hypothetical protein